MNEISLALVLVLTVVQVIVGFLAALRSAESMEEVHGEQQSQLVLASFVIINAFFGLMIKVMPSLVYAIILILIAILQWINQEGWMRRQSYNLLAAGYAFLLIVSVVAHRRDSFVEILKWTTLLWLIPIAAPFIVGAVRSARLGKKKTGVESNIVPWAVTVILTIAVIILFVLVLTK